MPGHFYADGKWCGRVLMAGVSVGLIAGLFVSFSMGSTASLWNESKVWTMTDFPLIRHIYF